MPLQLKGKKWPWIAGGLVVAGGWYFLRKRGQSSSIQSGANQSGIDPNTGIPYSQESGIDPNTGVPYADEYGGGYGGYGFQSPFGLTPGTTTTTVAPTTTTTNAQWAQAAESYMITLGYNPLTVGNALGKYLLGAGLDDSQYNIVQSAIGFEGYPPQPVPPPHRTNPQGHKGRGLVRVPNVVGFPAPAAIAVISASGLRAHRDTSFVGIVQSQEPRGGERIDRGDTVNLRGSARPAQRPNANPLLNKFGPRGTPPTP